MDTLTLRPPEVTRRDFLIVAGASLTLLRLGQAKRFWIWHVIIAEEIDAEALLLPGPCFHVFTGIREGQSSPHREEFEKKVADLIAAVRNVYHGKLIMNGSTFDYRFPGLADLIGVTTDDTWHPDNHDAPGGNGDFARARFAEAVLAKRYGRYTGQ